jgi:hypothetical protein
VPGRSVNYPRRDSQKGLVSMSNISLAAAGGSVYHTGYRAPVGVSEDPFTHVYKVGEGARV